MIPPSEPGMCVMNMYLSPRATVTRCHKPGGLQQQFWRLGVWNQAVGRASRRLHAMAQSLVYRHITLISACVVTWLSSLCLLCVSVSAHGLVMAL